MVNNTHDVGNCSHGYGRIETLFEHGAGSSEQQTGSAVQKCAPGGRGSTPDTLFVAKAYRLNEIFRENGN